MTDSVYAFNRLTPEHQRLAGGKGSTLARLCQAGRPVPDGLVILPTGSWIPNHSVTEPIGRSMPIFTLLEDEPLSPVGGTAKHPLY